MKKSALFSETGTLGFFKKGFTLIELVVVISIIAILSTLALFGFSRVQASGRDATRAATMNSLRSALERYYADKQQYPAGNFVAAVQALANGGYISYSNVSDPGPGACGTAAIAASTTPDAVWKPCGATTTSPVYAYDSSTTAYDATTYKAGCTSLAQTCYALFLKNEATGNVSAYKSPQ